MGTTDADFKAQLAAYRAAVEGHVKAKFAFAFFPDLEHQVSAPLLARAESKLQAAEINLLSMLRKVA